MDQWQIHHDNAPAYSVQLILQFCAGLCKCNTLHVYQAQIYATFFLFFKLKIHLKRKKFEGVEDIKRNAMVQLHTISKEESEVL